VSTDLALAPLTLILGGARSGKSRHGEALVEAAASRCVYVATAGPGDAEMAERIALHRARRGTRWATIEEPLDLVGALERSSASDTAVLVECLTLWLSNLLGDGRDVVAETRRLVEVLPHLDGAVVLVSNEVGLGIVPTSTLARAFIDHAGRLHQAVAGVAQSVVFMAAGLPLPLKASH